ncbi:MAG: SIR2 family protein [Anaerolineae bacterium]
MRVLELHDGTTEAMIVTMLQKRNLVPVLGAGFTRGAPTQSDYVPAADEFRTTMLAILRERVGSDADYLKDKSFAEVAEYFLNPAFVPTTHVKDTIRKYFTGVKLNSDRKAFLSCPWPYIYTLNIDDAIESNSSFRNKVVPNRPISSTSKQLPCVYKVHGDATDELIYDEPSKIIFSTAQYVRSLTTNLSMLNSLKTDLIEQNTLFVGCSLTQEIDLLYALAEYNNTFPEGRSSIYVTAEKPNNFEMAKLASHGINAVLLAPDYDVFYQTVARWGMNAEPQVGSLIAPHLSSPNLRRLNGNRQTNLSFLLRDPYGMQPGITTSIPDYYVRRDNEDEILRVSRGKRIVLIRGRRYSGRTLLLRSIASSAISRKVYLFESNTTISTEALGELSSVRNGLFIFDTNVLSPEGATSLARCLKSFETNDSAAIVAVNRTEPDIVGALVRYVDDEADFELQPRLSKRECDDLNGLLDALGLLRFDCNKTLLDNTFNFIEKYPKARSDLLITKELTEEETEVLLVTAIVQKAWSSLATALQMRTNEMFTLCEKLGPVVEVLETSRDELRDYNSRYKIVVNSKVGLALLIRRLATTNGFDWLSERIGTIVTRLISLPKFAFVAHQMYMFDAINFILSPTSEEGDGTGYRPVVLSLYERLQPTLNNSADYWLQRAKATLSLENNEQALLDGVGYAMKAYHDAQRERTIDNAEFTVALLYGKLCSVTRYQYIAYIEAAIEWFSRAISNYNRNTQYVQSILEGNRYRRNSFHQLCDYLEGEITAVELLLLRDDIQFLLSTRRSWRRGT